MTTLYYLDILFGVYYIIVILIENYFIMSVTISHRTEKLHGVELDRKITDFGKSSIELSQK